MLEYVNLTPSRQNTLERLVELLLIVFLMGCICVAALLMKIYFQIIKPTGT